MKGVARPWIGLWMLCLPVQSNTTDLHAAQPGAGLANIHPIYFAEAGALLGLILPLVAIATTRSERTPIPRSAGVLAYLWAVKFVRKRVVCRSVRYYDCMSCS